MNLDNIIIDIDIKTINETLDYGDMLLKGAIRIVINKSRKLIEEINALVDDRKTFIEEEIFSKDDKVITDMEKEIKKLKAQLNENLVVIKASAEQQVPSL